MLRGFKVIRGRNISSPPDKGEYREAGRGFCVRGGCSAYEETTPAFGLPSLYKAGSFLCCIALRSFVP